MRWLLLPLLLTCCDPVQVNDPRTPGEPSLRLPPPTQKGPTSADVSGAFEVGPGRKFPDLHSVAPLLGPGDVVTLQGNARYRGGVRFSRPGAEGRPITIRGVVVDGKRPVIEGSVDSIEVAGDHYVFENLEITGASKRCFFHHAHGVVIRNSFIHDCMNGLLGADDNSGSLTIEASEFARSGDGTYHHQIYMATDETAHPGAVFVLRHCFIHSGKGGNNVKSRAEKNRIVENWIEGARYHEVELVGPDGQDPALAREDGEVVGNVIFKTGDFHAVRIGGDGTGDTGGRYRFVNNTFIMAGPKGVIRLQDRVESIELFNNVFAQAGGGTVTLFRDETVRLRGGPLVSGAHNWFPEGSVIDPALERSRLGRTPGFVDLAAADLRPLPKGALVGAGQRDTSTNATHPLLDALAAPSFEPPARKLDGSVLRARAARGPISIGAFEP